MMVEERSQESETNPAEIPLLTLEISLEDALLKRSAFNPYPEKAQGKGLQVWTIQHPTPNPIVEIRYPKTGEIYSGRLPITYPVKEIPTPSPAKQPPQSFVDMDGVSYGEWMEIEEYWPLICEDMVENAAASSEELQPHLQRAISPKQDKEGKPILEKAGNALFNILRIAQEKAQAGDWRVAVGLTRYGHRLGSYTLYGETVGYDRVGIFDYSCYALGADIFPELAYNYPAKSLVLSDFHPSRISGRVLGLVESEIEIAALSHAINTEQNPTVKENLMHALNLIERRNTVIKEALSGMTDANGNSLLNRITKYLEQKGITITPLPSNK